jgi:hypothetical protein
MDEKVRTNPIAEGVKPWVACAADPGAWCEITEEDYWYCLEVLPPYYFDGGFAVSEACTHNDRGEPTYLCVATVKGRHYARELTLREANIEAPRLRAAVAA